MTEKNLSHQNSFYAKVNLFYVCRECWIFGGRKYFDAAVTILRLGYLPWAADIIFISYNDNLGLES